jgi:membrane-anchored protein YejM (alkaline phosphatase superfamily)
MHDQDELNEGAWERDRDNTSALLDYIDKRDAARPFLTFLFFESTHARYSFPDSAIVRQPFLENIDYTEMSREKLAPYADQLRNRYSNSAHWVDVQIGRIVDYLDQHHMLDNTVFIFAGDHGEEFMEKGFWGHNSSFVEEQTHTPLVMWMPGKPPQAIERTTSHMDIAVTLLQMLGASNDVDDYAQGRNLFDDNSLPDKDNSSPDKNNPPRDFIVMSDWHSIGIKSADFKYRIPYTSRGMENYHPTHSDDSPYANAGAERDAIAEHQKIILDAVRNITRFAK